MPQGDLTQKKIENICNDIQTRCEKALKTKEYQNLLADQNAHWKEVFNAEHSVIPAMGINYQALVERIIDKMQLKFGACLQLFENESKTDAIKTWIPTFDLLLFPLNLYDRNRILTSEEAASYLPNDIDEIIQDWLKTDESIGSFVSRINYERHSFSIGHDAQKRFIFLDIFFTALEMRLNDLPKENKIDEDYVNSIYINPDFLKCELPNVFPFYRLPRTAGDGNEGKKNVDRIYKIDSDNSMNICHEAAYPLPDRAYGGEHSPEAYVKLSEDFNREIDSFRSSRFSSKILKACYPIYFFVYNNILESLIREPEAITLRRKGCNFTSNSPGLSPIIDALKLHLTSYIYSKENKEESISISSQLYALQQALNYMGALCDYNRLFVHGKNNVQPHLECEYFHKKGNSKEAARQIVKITCNLSLTAWLFIRYSDLFHIALMPQIDTLFSANGNLKSKAEVQIMWPKNFFTALNFKASVFRDYPTLFKKYNDYIGKKAKILYNHYKRLGVKDWLQIAELFARKATYVPWAEIDYIGLIIAYFLASIRFRRPRTKEDTYVFKEDRFRKYLKRSRIIDSLQKKYQ